MEDKKSSDLPPMMASPAVCGFPSPAEQYVDSPLNLHELLVKKPAATYFVRADGDSMTGAGIRSGDILVVDRSLEPGNGTIVIACVDNEFTVKYYPGRSGDIVRVVMNVRGKGNAGVSLHHQVRHFLP